MNAKQCLFLRLTTLICKFFEISLGSSIVGFPKGRDTATFRDKGTEVSSLSQDKGTTERAQNLARGQDSLSKSWTGQDTGQSIFFCQNPGRDGISCFFLFQNILSCFRTSFNCFRTSFSFFFFFGESDFVPGQKSLSQDFFSCICPGTKGQRDKELFLSRDKGTTGRPILDCPGTSFGTSCPLKTLLYTNQV